MTIHPGSIQNSGIMHPSQFVFYTNAVRFAFGEVRRSAIRLQMEVEESGGKKLENGCFTRSRSR